MLILVTYDVSTGQRQKKAAEQGGKSASPIKSANSVFNAASTGKFVKSMSSQIIDEKEDSLRFYNSATHTARRCIT